MERFSSHTYKVEDYLNGMKSENENNVKRDAIVSSLFNYTKLKKKYIL